MQAVVVRLQNNILQPFLEDIDVPHVNNNEVLIKIKKTGICGSDIHLFTENKFSGKKTFPQIIGHEFSGIIEEKGENVTGLACGDYVASESVVSCGKCKNCEIIEKNNCNNAELIGFTRHGAFAEYVCIDYRHVHKINSFIKKFGEEKGLILGALLEPLGCAYKAIFLINKMHDFDKKNFVVLGAGPIGLGAAWLLSTLTTANVYLVDEVQTRLNLARNMRCILINAHISDEFFSSGIIPKSDFIFETSGIKLNLNNIVPVFLNSNSVMIYVSRNAVNLNVLMDTFVSNDFTLIGSRGHRGAFPDLINLMLKQNVDSLLTIVERKQISLSELVEVIKDKNNLIKGKIIVNI